MRLVGQCRPRHAVRYPSFPLLRTAVIQVSTRSINSKPRHQRPHPITEQITLRPQPNTRAQSIGILGGGITGLTSAWHLSRLIPDAKITIYEKQDRVGGWLDSEIVEVDGGEVLFEWGPRSLRPDPAGSGRATILLLTQLKLEGDIIGTTKTAPAALNRFIFYGDHLVKMPGPDPKVPGFVNAWRNGLKLLTEPIFKGFAGSILAEYWVQTRPASMTDESVGDFIRRRFGKTAADNIASAFFHGIYAGDLYQLSARTLLPALWHMETRDPEGAGILMEMADIAFKGQGMMQFKHGRYTDLLEAAFDSKTDERENVQFQQIIGQESSVYTFGRGLQALGDRLQEKLRDAPNVKIRTGNDVKELKFNSSNKKTTVVTQTADGVLDHDYVVSTLSARKLADFIKSSTSSRGVTLRKDVEKALQDSDKSVNVGVVNLYYQNPDLISSKHRGFGYLIPRSVNVDQNPERALGVIFGSETSGIRGPRAFYDQERADAKFRAHYGDIEKRKKLNPRQLAAVKLGFAQGRNEGPPNMLALVESMMKSKEAFTAELSKSNRFGQDTAEGTKLTVMIGGHWWNGWADADLPTEEELIDMAKSLLARHLKITETPLVAKARINRDCIPQYHVGYRQRMSTIHRGLMEEFQGRLKVAGPWWQGAVGVNDCIQNAHITAFNIREEWDDETGLKEYTEKEKWLICDRRTQTFTLDTVR